MRSDQPEPSPMPAPAPAHIASPAPSSTRPPVPAPDRSHAVHQAGVLGVVTKSPHFYPFYTGPTWAALNAVRASAKLKTNGDFTFTGTNQGRIRQAPAVYVWGIDRNGNLPKGPFVGRPNIRFDAVVMVRLEELRMPTAQVVDLVHGTATDLPAYQVRIKDRRVSVTVPSKLLPSTGLAPAQYRFNYWPEDGGPPVSSSVASFAPEFTNAQVGITHRG